jgi:DNA-binding YbaB/EbfC family protein
MILDKWNSCDRSFYFYKTAFFSVNGSNHLQEELETMEIPGESENGLVTVYLSGNQEPRGIEIDPSLLSQDLEIVAGSILEAMKAAYDASTETMRSKMEELTMGLNISSM